MGGWVLVEHRSCIRTYKRSNPGSQRTTVSQRILTSFARETIE
jgi:hypothetical protein